MQSTIMNSFRFGNIVLLNFASNVKKRLALVLAHTSDVDIIACRMASQTKFSEWDVELSDWKQEVWNLFSIAGIHKIAILEVTRVEKKIGELSPVDNEATCSVIKNILSQF